MGSLLALSLLVWVRVAPYTFGILRMKSRAICLTNKFTQVVYVAM